jgi:hypothetical protein
MNLSFLGRSDSMSEPHKIIDKVRASRDGHEFHEAWAARKALQLVMPREGLVGIAVEGLAPADQAGASSETVEIADLVFYYGNRPTFYGARSVVIIQVKYSISKENVPFRASDAKKTIKKFAAAFKNHKNNYGAENVEKKLFFELITNRPIFPELQEAIDGLATKNLLKGNAKKQADQFISASGLKGKALTQFAQKFRITGLAGSLKQNKQLLSRVLADWSVARDAMARARLGNMRQLLRDKAGSAGEGKNVIRRTDVLDALELQSPEDLFPCPASFPEVGKVVEREQLSIVASIIPKLDKPLLIHADGGIGKTVFLQSLAKVLGETHEIALFDCFGGGAYRAPDDSRHLPKRGLIHIINNLASDGLCDPLLPINENVEELVKAFRARLTQAVATLQRGSSGKQLLLFIDAIDNAAEHANDKGESAFPQLLLESFYHNGPVAGVKLIVSCRTYRRDISIGEVPCEEFELKPFSPAEAKKYLRARSPKVTDTEIQVAYSRSEGNPRILEHLALSERGLLDTSEINNVIELDELLRERIHNALTAAKRQGYRKADINAFLAGLSVLPPPIPIDEYADAHGMDPSAIRSFAADLAPLLELTRYGLMFRDEPTETLVREGYAANTVTLSLLADNLLKKQETSVYAASALPGLLQKLDDGPRLFDLAFDDRFPSTITSTVGKQNIRYARLKAAVLHSARKSDFSRLVRLLVELSTLAAVDQRGTEYVLDNPDLVIASHDVDATRRLFETRTNWPGTRHARLTIARALSGDLSDAYRHSVAADEWINHFYRQDDEHRREMGGPERFDIASIPLCLIAQDRGRDAAQFMKGWRDWYAYEVSERIFTLLLQAERMETISVANIDRFLKLINSQFGVLAAVLSFLNLDKVGQRHFVKKLANVCGNAKTIEPRQNVYQKKDYVIQDGLMKAASIAISMKMSAEASSIVQTIPYERPRLWSFMDYISAKDLFPFIANTALRAILEGRSVSEGSIIPHELTDISALVPNETKGNDYRRALKAKLEEYFKSQQGLPAENSSMNYESKKRAERFIDDRHAPLLEMSHAFTAILSSGTKKSDKPFLKLISVWTELRKKRELYSSFNETNLFFDQLGRQLLVFALWARSDLKASSVEVFAAKVSEGGVAPTSTLIKIIAILAKRVDLQELAGRMAIKAKANIEREDEVSYRASLLAQLARAIVPASIEEAAFYFRAGLEQMDAIGSGDYQFTNELLLFAASLKGSELDESEFHTLSNICELNMSSEEEKFPWLAFARGLARTSGCKTLAKLGRWSDREKVPLDYTLLPYLTALIEQDKIDPSIALGLLRVSDPAELYSCGTEQLAEIITIKQYPNSKELLIELITQFEQNNPGDYMNRTFKKLHEIAETQLGRDSENTYHLSLAAQKYEELRDERNVNQNYHRVHDSTAEERAVKQEEKNRRALKNIEAETDPSDETSMSKAIEALNAIHYVGDSKSGFFEKLRRKISYADRLKYIQIIARLNILDIYTKLSELKECKAQWGTSSAALENVFGEIGLPIVQIHADDLVGYDHLSGYHLNEIAELSGIPISRLALELIKIFASPDSHQASSVWMGLAAFICDETNQGEGQLALKRLLNSSSAKLASNVTDGVWKDGLYPTGGEEEIATGLVWLTLGSPYAAHRWRAAHSIRCFARFGKWKVIDSLIRRFYSTDAHPFQAPELPFYFLHARLWLLIAIARVAIDHPRDVAKYADTLRAISLDKDYPHILMRHFAAQALLVCSDSGSVKLSKADAKVLRNINQSPFPKIETDEYKHDSFYQGRPDSMPEPDPVFSLDYDFDKLDVTNLSSIFDRSRWETKDALTAWVRKYDSQITSMYENTGRHVNQREHIRGMTSRYHFYGQQLGLHALYLVAGEFLGKYPVFQHPYDEGDSWYEWLKRHLLTRKDGLWLSDGVDRPPLDAQVNLCEKGKDGPVITGDKTKLLSLLNLQKSSMPAELVVAGDWRSADDIKIHIMSALVRPRGANELARQLSLEYPFQAWLPFAEAYEDGTEHSNSNKEHFEPWIVWPSFETGIDETDLLGITSTVSRFHLIKKVNDIRSLKSQGPFRQAWVDPKGKVVARSEAWGHKSAHGDEVSARRLLCSTDFLKEVLPKRRAELLVLEILRKNDRGYGSQASQFWHTTAVVRITKSLKIKFYPGVVNKLHESH